MKDKYLSELCFHKKWDKVRGFLHSNSTTKDKKREFVFYRGSRWSWTCLHKACCEHPPADIIKSLLDIGGKRLVMMITTPWKNTALHHACSTGASFDVIKMLIDVGGKDLVMAKNHHGCNALHYLCYYINKHHNAAKKIKLVLQVANTEAILTEENYDGKTPLDVATEEEASDEIKALLQPRSIKNDPAIARDDTSNLVPDDHANNTTTTMLQDQLQATKQRNAHLETQIETQKTEQRKTIADLEAENILLSEQNAKQDKDNTDWKDRVEKLTKLCSEQKVELQELKDSARVSISNVKRESDDEDDDHQDQDNSPSHAWASKRSRSGSTASASATTTANELHAVEDNAETLMEELLCEKEQHIQEKQKNIKLLIQLRDVRKKIRKCQGAIGSAEYCIAS